MAGAGKGEKETPVPVSESCSSQDRTCRGRAEPGCGERWYLGTEVAMGILVTTKKRVEGRHYLERGCGITAWSGKGTRSKL